MYQILIYGKYIFGSVSCPWRVILAMQNKLVMIVSSDSIQAFTAAQEIAAILPVGVAKQRYRNRTNYRPYTIYPL